MEIPLEMQGEEGMSLTERRWNEVSNLREVLARSGCDVRRAQKQRHMACCFMLYIWLRYHLGGSYRVV